MPFVKSQSKGWSFFISGELTNKLETHNKHNMGPFMQHSVYLFLLDMVYGGFGSWKEITVKLLHHDLDCADKKTILLFWPNHPIDYLKKNVGMVVCTPFF